MFSCNENVYTANELSFSHRNTHKYKASVHNYCCHSSDFLHYPQTSKKNNIELTHTHSFMYSTVIVMQHYIVHYNFYYCGCICTMYMITYTCSSLRLSCCQPPHPSTLQVSLAGPEECRVLVWQDEDLSMTMLEL